MIVYRSLTVCLISLCYMKLSSEKVFEWPPYGKELLTQVTVPSECSLYIEISVISNDRILVLIVPVAGHCLPFCL